MSEPVLVSRLIGVDEYLEFERESPTKHEYVGGHIFAMSGTSKRHNRIAGNIFSKLDALAADGPCRVYIADVKVRSADDMFHYPDVMVACGPEGSDAYVEEAPCLLVEVTSPRTEVVDRREKLVAYRKLPSLRAYLVVHQEHRRVDRFWLDERNAWRHAVHTSENGDITVPVPCPETVLTLDEIYARAG